MKHKLYILIMLALSVNVQLFAQARNYNESPWHLKAHAFWAWYDKNGLDFSTGAPVYIPTNLLDTASGVYAEGVSSVSDVE